MADKASLIPLHPPGWPPARGYAHGMAGRGRIVCVSGQVGWDSGGHFPAGFTAQAAQALRNILAVLAEAGAGPRDIARLTWYVLDMAEYRASLSGLGAAWRAVMGRHFPAITLVQVAALVEPEARLEIEATAVVPE